MPKDVVHFLEPVDVDAQEGKGQVYIGSVLENVPESLVKEGAIGYIGQRVVMCQMCDTLLCPATLCDVFMRSNPPTSRHRTIRDRNGAAVMHVDHSIRGLAFPHRNEDRRSIVVQLCIEASGADPVS